MDRLDARTASFFAIGLLVLSFGCKSGAALHALGAGAVTAAKVATVVPRRRRNQVRRAKAVSSGRRLATAPARSFAPPTRATSARRRS